MPMRRKKWLISKADKEFASRASHELGTDPLATLIVTSRGLEDTEELAEFFDDDAPLTLDPLSIKDMDLAAERINRAIDDYELICVFGDYDADGVTSTALIYSYLESRGANVIRYIPDRISEGYGLNNEAIENLANRGVKLIVTVDNGVTANEEVAFAYSLGIQVVVTDHHQTGETLPECEAVVDPHRADCPSEFKEMSGVGVAFKLACALEGGNEDELLDEYGELVALGTIGDVVSLTGENRVMVRRGIRNINEHPGIGLAALVEAAGVKTRPFSASTAAFALCPRINAAGRMGSAEKALELLLCDDDEEAMLLAQEIAAMNSSRQSIETEIYGKAVDMISANPELANDRIIVVDGEGWHQGVIGIVAARITEHYGRPSVVISRNGGFAKGSCRSIEGFSIFEAIESVSDMLTHFGGHTLAAGVSLNSEDIPLFRKRINEYASGAEMPFAVQKIDCRINPSHINAEILPSVAALEPIGAGNPQPCFGLFGVTVEDVSGVSDGKHTRLIISKDKARTGAVMFGLPDRRFPFSRGDVVDLAVNFEKNTYNGEIRVSTVVRAIRPSATDEEKVLECISLYDRFLRGEKLTAREASRIIPDRNTQVEVFMSLKSAPLKDSYCEMLCVRLGDDGSKLASYMATVDMMIEMGILVRDGNGTVSVPGVTEKVNLEESETMKKLRSMQV